jgi:hypothetical protein
LKPTSMEHDPKPKIGPIPWDPPKFWGPTLGGPLGLLEYLLLGHQYIYIYLNMGPSLKKISMSRWSRVHEWVQLGWLESIEVLVSLMENGSCIEQEMVHLLFKIVLKIMHHSCTLVCLLVERFLEIYIFLIIFYHFIINLLLLVVHGFV